jgi:WD40 repeat protein
MSIPVPERNAFVGVTEFSPDGRLMLGAAQVYAQSKKRDDYTAWLKWWDVASGRELASIEMKLGGCFFLPDGKTIAAIVLDGDRCGVSFFNVADQKLLTSVELDKKAKGERLISTGRALSPDGRWLAVVTQRFPEKLRVYDSAEVAQAHVHLIDVAARAERETLVMPQAIVHSVAFSPDGKTLATGGWGRVLLWDVTNLSDALSSRSQGGHSPPPIRYAPAFRLQSNLVSPIRRGKADDSEHSMDAARD